MRWFCLTLAALLVAAPALAEKDPTPLPLFKPAGRPGADTTATFAPAQRDATPVAISSVAPAHFLSKAQRIGIVVAGAGLVTAAIFGMTSQSDTISPEDARADQRIAWGGVLVSGTALVVTFAF